MIGQLAQLHARDSDGLAAGQQKQQQQRQAVALRADSLEGISEGKRGLQQCQAMGLLPLNALAVHAVIVLGSRQAPCSGFWNGGRQHHHQNSSITHNPADLPPYGTVRHVCE